MVLVDSLNDIRLGRENITYYIIFYFLKKGRPKQKNNIYMN